MKTKKYYDSNPEAKKKKKEYDTKYHATEERKKYRAFLNKTNRKAGKYGNGDGMDYDHSERRFVKAAKNRAKKWNVQSIFKIIYFIIIHIRNYGLLLKEKTLPITSMVRQTT